MNHVSVNRNRGEWESVRRSKRAVPSARKTSVQCRCTMLSACECEAGWRFQRTRPRRSPRDSWRVWSKWWENEAFRCGSCSCLSFRPCVCSRRPIWRCCSRQVRDAELFIKYGAVFVATLAGLATTAVRGRNLGLIAFALVALASCVLDRSRLLAYPTLLVLAIPGLMLAPPLVLVTRWSLRRAHASRCAWAWIAALVAGPFACLGYVSLVYEGEASLVAHFAKLGFAAAISCNLLLSVVLIASGIGMCLHAAYSAVAAGALALPHSAGDAMIRERGASEASGLLCLVLEPAVGGLRLGGSRAVGSRRWLGVSHRRRPARAGPVGDGLRL